MNEPLDTRTLGVESVLQTQWPVPLWLTIVLATLALFFVGGLYFTERGEAKRPLRTTLAAIRFALLMLVVWMLAGWSWQRFRSDKPELLFVLDRSASMATPDGLKASDAESVKLSRFQAALEVLGSLDETQLKRLEQDYQLRWVLIDQTPEVIDVAAQKLREELEQVAVNGPQSRLGDSLSSVISGQAGRSTAAIVLFSDGINTTGSPLSVAAAAARSATIPVFAVATGQELAAPDARLADLLVDDTVFLGDQVIVQVTASVNDVAEANLRLSLKDGSSGETLDQQDVRLTKELNQQQLSLVFTPKRAGDFPMTIELSEIAGEANLENNTLQRTIVVQDRTFRVLLVQRAPSFEFRFLKNLLQRSRATDERAASFELHSVLQESDAEYIEQDSNALRLVPSDQPSLAGYDVFIFGDLAPELISRSAQQLIFKQVTEQGAGCIFIAGRDTAIQSLVGWPLGDLLPIQLNTGTAKGSILNDVATPQRWSPTVLGSASLPMQLAESPDKSLNVWLALPPIVSRFTPLTPKTGAQVLAATATGGRPTTSNENESIGTQTTASAAASDSPLLISQFAGAGRVAFQATDETYRWTSYAGSDRFHQRYWEQMLRWLSRGRMNSSGALSQLSIEPRRAKLGQPVRFELRLGSDAEGKALEDRAELTLFDVAGKQSGIKLSREAGANRVYSTVKSDLAPGSYRAVVYQPSLAQPPSESFSVVTPPGEQANLRADWAALRQLADQSRGRFYHADSAQELFEQLPAGKRSRLGTLPPLPLWNNPWIALIFVLLITSEWLLRRRARML